ncbi:hypothetical protein KUCAC02_000632, partial [Chaenocephalus aceratus]
VHTDASRVSVLQEADDKDKLLFTAGLLYFPVARENCEYGEMEGAKEHSDFQKITRVMFKLLRTYHNWGPIRRAMVGTGPILKNISQTRDWLMDSLKPSLPKGVTADLLGGNATNWLQTGLQILDENYQGTSADLRRNLSREDSERAWIVASRWLRCKYPHAQDQVFALARADLELLGLQLPAPVGPDPTNPRKKTNPRTRADLGAGPEAARLVLTMQTPALVQTTPSSSPDIPLPSTQPTLSSSPDIPLPSTQPSPRFSQTGVALAVLEVVLEGSTFNKIGLGAWVSDPGDKIQEVSRAVRATLLPPLGLHLGVEVPVAPVVKSVGESSDRRFLDNSKEWGYGPEDRRISRNFADPRGNPIPGGSGQSRKDDSYRPPSPASPSLPLFTRHEHRGNKTLNWDLKPSREILIVGASNIARLPLVRDSRVQVDSFPGANVSQAATLIRNKTPTSPGVQQVVLSFGFNDREKRNPTLLEDNFLRLWNAARETFPNAVIYSPIINISDAANPKQIENIRILN